MQQKIDFYKHTIPFLTCKDFTVSNASFTLNLNKELDMLVTQPVPENLDLYYKSENYISHTDSKKSIIDRVYHFVKKITLKQKLTLINSFKTSEKKLLDVGAGTGDFLKFCKQNQWDVTGVEPNKDAVKIAKQKGVNLYKQLQDVSKNKYDVITLWHVLEHVKDLESYIEQLKNCLTKNGKLIIAVPNYNSYDAQYYKDFWAAYDVPRHLWHFSKTAITTLFNKKDMVVQRVLPMKFDAYYVSLLSETYKHKKSRPIHAFYRGFLSNLKARKNLNYSSLIYVITHK